MKVPESLDGWTFEVLQDLVGKSLFESDRHDFKRDLPNDLTKLVCAFANSDGGFLVFGVGQRNGEWAMDGLTKDHEFMSRFTQKLKAAPSVHFEEKIIPLPKNDKILIIVHVPASPFRPHVSSVREEGFFWKRSNGNCELMSIEEIRAMFRNFEERREKLKLLWLELDYNYSLLHASPYIKDEPNLDVFTTAILDTILVDAYSLLKQRPQIIQDLHGIKRLFHQINERRALFISEMGQPMFPGAKKELVAAHNQRVAGRSRQLMDSIDRVKSHLKDQFALTNPWERENPT